MPLFQRKTKTRVSSQGLQPITVKFFEAAACPAVDIKWIADDKKQYTLVLYGDEISTFKDQFQLAVEEINMKLNQDRKNMREALLTFSLMDDVAILNVEKIKECRAKARDAINLSFLDRHNQTSDANG